METWMRLCFIDHTLSQGSHSSQVVYEDYFTWQRTLVCKLIHHSLCQLFVSELGLYLKCHLPDAQLLVIMLIYYPDVTGFYQAPLLQTAGGGTRASAVALLSMATGAV